MATYAEISSQIQAWTEVDSADFVAQIPTFVQNAEKIINNTAEMPAFRVSVVNTVTTSFPYIKLPADFLSVFSLASAPGTIVAGVANTTGPYNYLLNKDVNYIRECFPYPGVTGNPLCYALFDASTVLIGPTPDQAYVVELHYYAYPASIVLAGTSWVGDNFPNVLLYGAITEAYIFLKGEQDLLQSYQAKFDQGLKQMKQLGDGKNRSDNFRVVPPTYKVE